LQKSIVVAAVFKKYTYLIFYRPLPDIRPDIQPPAFGLAGYPAKTVSGASLLIKTSDQPAELYQYKG
jgi:hypothetical protein